MKLATAVMCMTAVKFLGLGLSLAPETNAEESCAAYAIVPVFSSAQASPEFLVAYTNDGDADADIPSLLEESVAVIDGVEHVRRVVKFVGNASLKRGETISLRIDLSAYLSGATKEGYSEETGRWRWKLPFTDGNHTLALTLDGKEYGPVVFFWNGDVPIVLKQEVPNVDE